MEKPTYKIHVICNGIITNFERSIANLMDRFGEKFAIPALSYLITGDGIDPILVDTGMGREIMAKNGFDIIQNEEHTYEYQLKQLGLSCEDIRCVIFTHLHFDHADNTWRFPNAKLILARREMMYMVAGIDFGYYPDYVTYMAEQLFIPGRVKLFDDSLELLPGLELVVTDGHSWGSTIINVNTEKGKACICGDVIYNLKGSTDSIALSPDMDAQKNNMYEPFGVWPTGVHLNRWSTINWISKIVRESDIILPSHDMTILEQYGAMGEVK